MRSQDPSPSSSLPVTFLHQLRCFPCVMPPIVTFYIITAQKQKTYLIKLWTKVFESV